MSYQTFINLANKYDSQGKTNAADAVDSFIQKWAQMHPDEEPTMEDLLEEEDWLKENDIDPYNLSEKGISDLLADLEKSTEEEAQHDLEQKKTLDMLQELMLDQYEEQDPTLLPHQRPLIGEAQLQSDLSKLGNMLDRKGFFKAADKIDKFLEKFAADEKDEESEKDEGLEEMEEEPELEGEIIEIGPPLMKPDDVTLLIGGEVEADEEEYSDLLDQSLGFIKALAEGAFESLEEAQDAAETILREYNENFPEEEMEEELEEESTSNILNFPKK